MESAKSGSHRAIVIGLRHCAQSGARNLFSRNERGALDLAFLDRVGTIHIRPPLIKLRATPRSALVLRPSLGTLPLIRAARLSRKVPLPLQRVPNTPRLDAGIPSALAQ
jgi:hypothetical protein